MKTGNPWVDFTDSVNKKQKFILDFIWNSSKQIIIKFYSCKTLKEINWIDPFFFSRAPYFYTISIGIVIYVGLLTVFVIANFGLATFMDPGIYPRGKDCQRFSSACSKTVQLFTVVHL